MHTSYGSVLTSGLSRPALVVQAMIAWARVSTSLTVPTGSPTAWVTVPTGSLVTLLTGLFLVGATVGSEPPVDVVGLVGPLTVVVPPLLPVEVPPLVP